jgi:hypothetical protein
MSSPLEQSTAETCTSSTAPPELPTVETTSTSTTSQEPLHQTPQSTTDISTPDDQSHEASDLLQADEAKKPDIQEVCSKIDEKIAQLKADLRRLQLRLQ